MNVPNALTLSRIVLSGVFLLLIFFESFPLRLTALLVFLIASATDYWDGKLARARNQISAFGQLMDPIADKILTISAFLAFLQMGILPAWMVLVVIGRELVVTAARFWLPAQGRSAGASGKQKTFFQLSFIVAILVILAGRMSDSWNPAWDVSADRFIEYGMLFIVIITLYSGLKYLWANRQDFRS